MCVFLRCPVWSWKYWSVICVWPELKGNRETSKAAFWLVSFANFIPRCGFISLEVSDQGSAFQVNSSGILAWHPDSGDILGSIPAGTEQTGNRDGFPSLTRHDKCSSSSSLRLPDLISCDCFGRKTHRWSPGLHGYRVTKVIGCRAVTIRCLLPSSSGCNSLSLSLFLSLIFGPVVQMLQ